MDRISIASGGASRRSTARRRSPKSKRCVGPQPVIAGLEFRQSNSEATLIDWIHEAIDRASAIVINPAAFSFTSIAILDALKMFPGPIFEVHISNIHRREEHYHRSYVSKVATGVIAGFGVAGYVISLRAASEALRG
jgi:3-dehydroquinate dehydratase-2